MPSIADEIINALENEIEATRTQPPRFEVTAGKQDADTWILSLQATDRGPVLDPELEGCTAWWVDNDTKATANVLAVDADEAKVTLRFLTGPPPRNGTVVFFFPQRFLDALLDCWSDGGWAQKCIEWRERNVEDGETQALGANRTCPGSPLREKQREALALTECPAGVLWGPPGTGKTYTLGAAAATFLVSHPHSKVLLLAPTNSATDAMIVSVDEALKRWGGSAQQELRHRMKRIGSQYLASTFTSRKHLLPTAPDEHELLEQLAQKEASVPGNRSGPEYARWKTDVEQLRKRLRVRAADVIPDARLIACTTTGAAFLFANLRDACPFHLVIFDEASQISRAYAYALAPLGERVVFAGDPQQLSPIVRSGAALTKKWVGASVLQDKSRLSESFLDEQSRMSEPICRVVASTFYPSRKLRVADDSATNETWLRHRRVAPSGRLGGEAIEIIDIKENGDYLPSVSGYCRRESAKVAVEIAREVIASNPDADVLILTPFRAQRRLIDQQLGHHRRGRVSTIHRAQGSERHTVIVDPVNASLPFVRGEEGRKLLNVAMSRAKARLVLLLSPEDEDNEAIRSIRKMLHFGAREWDEPVCTLDVQRDREFPADLAGKVVLVGGTKGLVSSARYPELIITTEAGKEKRFQFRAKDGPIATSPTPNEPAAPRFQRHAQFVYDREMQLAWQRPIEKRQMRFREAEDFASRLQLCGGRWRLPTLAELASLVVQNPRAPMINRDAFPEVPGEWFWSSTLSDKRPGPSLVSGISFWTGKASPKEPTGRGYVWCVSEADFGAATLPAVRRR